MAGTRALWRATGMNDEDFSQDKRWDSLDTDSKQGSIRSEAHAYTVPEVQPY